MPVSGLKRTIICKCLIPDFYAVFIIIVIVFPYFRLLYISRSFHLQSHNTCRVWKNFPKTVRTNKIVMRAIMLFIWSTKTIVESPLFWNSQQVCIWTMRD